MRAPAGCFELDALAPWVVGAGAVVLCLRSGVEAAGPIPRLHPAEYNAMVEEFLQEHRRCAELHRGAA